MEKIQSIIKAQVTATKTVINKKGLVIEMRFIFADGSQNGYRPVKKEDIEELNELRFKYNEKARVYLEELLKECKDLKIDLKNG